MNEQDSDKANVAFGAWLSMGTAIGVAIGISMDNLAAGIAIGCGLGVAIGAIARNAALKNGHDGERGEGGSEQDEG